MARKGIFYGVGVGPGDPQLLTLKASHTIEQAPVISFIANEKNESLARRIALLAINKKAPGSFSDLPLVMPMCNDRTEANRIYDRGALAIRTELDKGKDVAFLCEGDPFFFGSFAYLHDRLHDDFKIEVIPGISSIHASAAQCGVPLGLLEENVVILSGRHSDDKILDALKKSDNIVIMKAGRRRSDIVNLIKTANRVEDACYIEYATQQGQKIEKNILDLGNEPGPYFSLFLINCRRSYR